MDKKRKKENLIAFIIIGVVILVVLGVVIYGLKVYKKKLYNKQTLCPLNVDYNQTFVIIDKSDKWKKKDTKKIKNLLLKIKNNLYKYERLTIKVMEPNENNESKVNTYFDMCNPGDGKDANPIYENQELIKIRYKKSFEEPLQKILAILLKPTKMNNSPILETLSDTLDNLEGKYANIHLISDTLENDIFNFYKNIPDINTTLEEYYFPKNKLSNLHIHYIERESLKYNIRESLNFFGKLAKYLNANYEEKRLFRIKSRVRKKLYFTQSSPKTNKNYIEVIPHERLRFLCKSINNTIADVTINKKYKQNLSPKKTFIFLSKGNFDLIVNGKKYSYKTGRKMYFVIENGQIKPIEASYFRNPN